MHKLLLSFALSSTFLAAPAAFAQTVDPGCIIRNADGTESVDMTKCPDGRTMGSAATPKTDSNAAGTDMNATGTGSNAAGTGANATGTGSNTAASGSNATGTDMNAAGTGTNAAGSGTNAAGTDGSAAGTAGATTGSTSPVDPNASAMVIAPEAFANARIISVNDFIGKRVYSTANEDIGEVNDLILSDNGNIRAVIVGVGGFLGMGEKDVAVNMDSFTMTPEGDSVRLVLNTNKDMLASAPQYDRSTRNYVQQ